MTNNLPDSIMTDLGRLRSSCIVDNSGELGDIISGRLVYTEVVLSPPVTGL